MLLGMSPPFPATQNLKSLVRNIDIRTESQTRNKSEPRIKFVRSHKLDLITISQFLQKNC